MPPFPVGLGEGTESILTSKQGDFIYQSPTYYCPLPLQPPCAFLLLFHKTLPRIIKHDHWHPQDWVFGTIKWAHPHGKPPAQAGLEVIIQNLTHVLPCPYIVSEFHILVRSIFFFFFFLQEKSSYICWSWDLHFHANMPSWHFTRFWLQSCWWKAVQWRIINYIKQTQVREKTLCRLLNGRVIPLCTDKELAQRYHIHPHPHTHTQSSNEGIR